MKRPILEHQEKGQTVNSATCSAMLKDKLKPAICNTRRLLSKNVLLHHNNACALSQLQYYRKFKTSSLRFCHIHLTVLKSHHVTFKPLVHLAALHICWFGSD
jgi:hypothetical protein